MKPTAQSTSTDVYYVENNNENVEFYHSEEQRDSEQEEIPDQSINTDDLPSTFYRIKMNQFNSN